MTFLSPITAIVAAAVAVPLLVALYFLKLRRREVPVPSTLLWRKSIHDLQVNSPFQKLRRNLLLLLQLLILACLLLAMARPSVQQAAAPGQRVAIVLDHSASMNATDVRPTRLEAAKAAAMRLIDQLAANGEAGGAMLVSFADEATVAQRMSRDWPRLRRAVEQVGRTDQPGRLAGALDLLEPYARQQAGEEQSLLVYVISDGRVAVEREELPALPRAEIRYLPIGSEQPANVGIVAFAARRSYDQPERVQVFARVHNAGPAPAETALNLRVDGELTQVQPLRLPRAATGGPGEERVTFELTLAGSALVEGELDTDDALPADDEARLIVAPARRQRVLLVGRADSFLSRGLRSAGVKELTVMSPAEYEALSPRRIRGEGDQAGWDLVVFDGYAPQAVPPVSSLSFAAAPPVADLALREPAAEGAQPVLDWRRNHPLLRHVSLDDVRLASPGRLVLPRGATVLASGQSGPLLASVSVDGTRHVVASFDVQQTNWPMQVSFPVFIANSVQMLGRSSLGEQAGLAWQAGEVAEVPVTSEAPVRYLGPAALEAQPRLGQAVLGPLRRAGLYEAEAGDPAEPLDRLAVNVASPLETDLRVAEQIDIPAGGSQAGSARAEPVRREIWPWLAWAALAVLLVEWLVYTRRMRM
ncbi:MAG: vWA domain-containing protein [Phycisphaeraceae bacterium]